MNIQIIATENIANNVLSQLTCYDWLNVTFTKFNKSVKADKYIIVDNDVAAHFITDALVIEKEETYTAIVAKIVEFLVKLRKPENIVDKSLRLLLAQNNIAYDLEVELCRYWYKGAKCAVGVLLSDEDAQYWESYHSGQNVLTVLHDKSDHKLAKDKHCLSKMQTIHDNIAIASKTKEEFNERIILAFKELSEQYDNQ